MITGRAATLLRQHAVCLAQFGRWSEPARTIEAWIEGVVAAYLAEQGTLPLPICERPHVYRHEAVDRVKEITGQLVARFEALHPNMADLEAQNDTIRRLDADLLLQPDDPHLQESARQERETYQRLLSQRLENALHYDPEA